MGDLTAGNVIDRSIDRMHNGITSVLVFRCCCILANLATQCSVPMTSPSADQLVGDRITAGFDVPTLVDPVPHADRLLFRDLISCVRQLREDKVISESKLHQVLQCLKPTLPLVEVDGWGLEIDGQIDLANFIDDFQSYPPPAKLIKWRDEVRKLVSAAAAPSSPTVIEQDVDDLPNYRADVDGVLSSSAPEGLSSSSLPTSKRLSAASSGGPSKRVQSEQSSAVGVRTSDGVISLDRSNRKALILMVMELESYNIVSTAVRTDAEL